MSNAEADGDAAWEKYSHDTTFMAGDGEDLTEYDVTDLVHEHWNICWDIATAAAESAHAAQLLAVAEAVRDAAAQAECGFCARGFALTFDTDTGTWRHTGVTSIPGWHIHEGQTKEVCLADAIRALDLAAIIRSALDGSVAGVGKAGE